MNKKIIFLFFQPLDKYNYKRWGFETFLNQGWDVECWLFFGKFYSIFNKKEVFYQKRENFYNFKSTFECLKRLKKLPKNFYFIDAWDGSLKSNIIQRLMILKGGKKIFVYTGLFPGLKNRTINLLLNSKISFKLFTWFFMQVIKVIYNKMNNVIFCPKPHYLFVSGNVSIKDAGNTSKNVKVINTHSFDYEEYSNLKNEPLKEEFKNSIVYIDQNLEGNYEFLLNNSKYAASKDLHWKSLNSFFDAMSKKLNKKVLIAAHHRRDKNVKIDTNCEVYYSQTPNLIKNSSLVLVHNSVALSYAILFKKPMIFITTDEIKKFSIEIDFSIKKFSEILNAKLININNFASLDKYNFFNFDEEAYNRWKEDYIKSPESKVQYLWEDFIKIVEKEKFK